MKLAENVKVKNNLWKLFPFSKFKGQAIYPNIYLAKEVYDDLLSENPSSRHIAILKHEQTHIKRQKEMGWFKWGLKYLFSRKFRFNEEFKAIRSSMKYLKKEGLGFEIERKARILSSWLYLWSASFEKAKKELDKVWKEV